MGAREQCLILRSLVLFLAGIIALESANGLESSRTNAGVRPCGAGMAWSFAPEQPQKSEAVLDDVEDELTVLAQAGTATAEQSVIDARSAERSRDKSSPAGTAKPDHNEPPMAGTPSANPNPDLNGYVIGEQDTLTVTVWKERELSSTVVVRPDGIITVPLAGDLKVTGMTTQQVQALLIEKLKPFITVPQVTVAVNQINSRKVYLIGQVVREGTFPLNSSTTILQIIAEAGGLKDFAKRKGIYVLRQKNGQQTRLRFNYDAVIRGKKQEENIQLEPGDTIVVP